MCPHGGPVLSAVLYHRRRLFPLCRRFQQPADQLLPLYERLYQGRRLPGQCVHLGAQYLLMGYRPRQRRDERLFVLPVRLAVLLVLAALPAGVAALPHGAAAGAQVCRGGRRCVPVSAPLRQKYRLRRAGSLSVYLLRLYGIQCVLQPLCRCGGAVPVSAVVAGRGPLQRPPQLVCVLGGGEPCQQLLLLHRSGGVSGHLLHLQAQHRRLPSHCKKVWPACI